MESRDGLLFHAAALAYHGQGILIPGNIGAGKSTFTAWLLSKGLNYLSDELVYVPCGTATLQPFTRPLHLKHPSRPILSPILNIEAHPETILTSSYSDLVPANLFNPNSTLIKVDLNLVLFPHYLPDAETCWQSLTHAQTGLALMQCPINARNLPEHGFKETVRLARRVPGYAFNSAHFNQIETELTSILTDFAS